MRLNRCPWNVGSEAGANAGCEDDMTPVMNSPGTLRHISHTALWVAVYRAHEIEPHDTIFHDPYASVLARDRGRQIAAAKWWSDAAASRGCYTFVGRSITIDK